MIAQARLSAIEERKPNPREKSKDLEQRARAILSHMPAPAAQDSASLSALLLPPQAAAYDGAAFRAAGCDPVTMKTAGIDVLSLVANFGYDNCAAAGCELSCVLVSRAPALLHAPTDTHYSSPPSLFLSLHFSATAPTCMRRCIVTRSMKIAEMSEMATSPCLCLQVVQDVIPL
jgi:hypothetical protein